MLDDVSDTGARAAVVTPGPEGFGRFIRAMDLPQPDHCAEGIAAIDADTVFLPESKYLGVKACSLSRHAVRDGWPVEYLFNGRRWHLAGVGWDGTHVIISATTYPPRPDKDVPVPDNWLLRVDPADGRPVALEWVGACLNDARGWRARAGSPWSVTAGPTAGAREVSWTRAGRR
ncbi:MAG: hypothetical protein J7M38_09805 [Armatimonadetes bacterium]|nr:hypothetical protein [Armatimonadota bacterium]